MSAQEKVFNPSDLTNEQLDRIAFALSARLEKMGISDKPMTKKEAADWMNRSVRQLERYISAGKITLHHIMPNTEGFLLKSEILEVIKKS